MNELSPKAKALLNRARAAGAPAGDAQVRVHQALKAQLAGGVALGAGMGVAKSAWGWLVPGAKLLGVVSVVGLSAAGWHALQAPSTNPAPLPAAAARLPAAPHGRAAQSTLAELPASNERIAAEPGAGTRRVPDPPPEIRAASTSPFRAPHNLESAVQGPRTAPASANPSAPRSDSPARAGAAPLPAQRPLVGAAAFPALDAVAEAPTKVEAAPGLSVVNTPVPSAQDSLASETEQLRAVQRAIRDGASERALQLLSRTDVRFPRGALAQERSAARIQALCKLGRTAAARAEAQRFATRWPESPLLGRVQAACH